MFRVRLGKIQQRRAIEKLEIRQASEAKQSWEDWHSVPSRGERSWWLPRASVRIPERLHPMTKDYTLGKRPKLKWSTLTKLKTKLLQMKWLSGNLNAYQNKRERALEENNRFTNSKCSNCNQELLDSVKNQEKVTQNQKIRDNRNRWRDDPDTEFSKQGL